MKARDKTRIWLAVVYAGLGLIALGVAAVTHQFPDLIIWLPFALVVVFLEWRSFEINDHLIGSPSVMAILAAIVAFGPDSAALGVAVIGLISPFRPVDFKQRRIIVPLVNLGQLVTTAVAAALVVKPFLAHGQVWTISAFPLAVTGAALGSLVYVAVNLGLVNLAVRVLYQQNTIRPWSRMGSMVPSSVMLGFMGGLVGATYHVEPNVLPLVFGLLLVGYIGVASYSQLREAHEGTLRGFIKALEAKDLYTRGHTERVAYFAQLIGEELRYRGTALERLRWAALIHDVGKLAVPGELIRKRGRLNEQEYNEVQRHAHVVEDILAEVEFLRPMVEIASGHHSRYDGTGYGGSGHTEGEVPSQEACILAVADSFDAMTSTRSYRMALTQEYAFEELRHHCGTQFDPVVVEALISALTRTGERYGSPSMDSEVLARMIAEDKVGIEAHGPHEPHLPHDQHQSELSSDG